MGTYLKYLWMLFILSGAAYQDIREGKISNAGFVFGILGICIFRCAEDGGKGVWYVFLYAGMTMMFFLPLFMIHAMGAGDIKLFSLVAGMHGLPDAFQVAVLWLLLAGVFSFWKMLSQHRLSQRMAYAWRYFKEGHFTHMPYYEKNRDGTKDTIPLAPFLSIAYFLIMAAGIWRELC